MKTKMDALYINEATININLDFYFFLKHLTKLKPTNKQITALLKNIQLLQSSKTALKESFLQLFKKSKQKLHQIDEINARLENSKDIQLFEYSIMLYQIKNLLLQKLNLYEDVEIKNLAGKDPLSLDYDKVSVLTPYKIRVQSALLSLLFFEKLHDSNINFPTEDFAFTINELSKKAIEFQKKRHRVEPNFHANVQRIDQSVNSLKLRQRL